MPDPASSTLIQQYLAVFQDRGVQPEPVKEFCDDNHLVLFIPGLGYLLVALSIEFPGLWHLDEMLFQKIQQRSDSESQPLWMAFLIERRDGRGANGYILKDLVSSPVKREIETNEGQFTIREKRHLDSLRLILSTEKQVDLLLRNRK